MVLSLLEIVRTTHDGKQKECLSGVATLIGNLIEGCARRAEKGFGWLVFLGCKLVVSC